ncbi:hypothetical protein Tmath_1498 [Thermoanaerobacter mathranii subsp. mathranii str. A3]|uniref:Uncharacterized protein n=1 Tax=Thermoanaerobacter mathranii subsp. mathranii (strain DSM 11426 / CCUG 53645 / CIP 108742 / A3) TaxID=583358 RepID=A0ABN3Z681_THEM3|nr:hypothetical protein [Thermoanaerobacter mathranii]ADH61209.1 hypothetical protein Tmath_1498 [Thermoanaerobacter mathranii subsp. mathranii str. A3]
MKNKLVWFVVFLVAYLITNVAVQFFWKGIINPGQVLGAVIGIAIAFLIVAAPKNSIVLWIGAVLVVLSVPIALVGLVSLFLSMFSIHFTGWGIIGIYVLGVLAILYLTMRFGSKQFFQNPVMDERSLLHYAWSGSWSFIFLNLLIIGALLQPWIAFDQLGLWVGVLIAGLLFWLTTLVILEMKK